jgi:hypothetical protein
LINCSTINNALKNESCRLAKQLAEEQPVPEVVDELYLAAYARKPNEEELQRLVSYVDAAEDKRAALEDVYWTILNSKEFVFNH